MEKDKMVISKVELQIKSTDETSTKANIVHGRNQKPIKRSCLTTDFPRDTAHCYEL